MRCLLAFLHFFWEAFRFFLNSLNCSGFFPSAWRRVLCAWRFLALVDFFSSGVDMEARYLDLARDL